MHPEHRARFAKQLCVAPGTWLSLCYFSSILLEIETDTQIQQLEQIWRLCCLSVS